MQQSTFYQVTKSTPPFPMREDFSKEGPIMLTKTADGFLTITVHDDLIDIHVTLALEKKIIGQVLTLLKGEARPFLFLYKELNVKMDNEVVGYIASHKDLLKVKKAEAIVTKSLVNRLVVNFFKPPAPVRVFKSEVKAYHFVVSFNQ